MANPVVAIPGYFGSKLADAASKRLIWIDGTGLLQPEVTLEALRLDVGDPNRVVPIGILDEVVILPPFWDPGFYKGLTKFLRDNLKRLTFEFFYDWRKSLEDAADLLDRQIQRWHDETGADQFDLVTHSFGGIVARAYLEQHGTDRVDRLVTLGSPHKGALETFEAITNGSKVFTFPAAKVKQVSRTFPSAFEVLPTDAADGLFTLNGANASAYQSNQWCATQPMKDLLAAAKGKLALLPPALPVDSYLIYGTRTATTSSAKFDNGKMKFDQRDQGDGTVPEVSASGRGLTAAPGKTLRRYAVPFGPHAHLFGQEKVQQRILTPILLRRDLPDVLLISGFRQEPIFVPRSTNLFAAAVYQADGTPVTNAVVKLTITGTTVKDQVIPLDAARQDYAAKIVMPGPGVGRRYTVTAQVPGIAETLRDEGLLVSTAS